MMRLFFMPFLLLPFLEIAGFIVIGGRLGVGVTFLWLVGSTLLGFKLLQSGGFTAFARARVAREEDIFGMQDLFDGICTLIAATLLIFPGFISDFLAIPFIIAPLRHWLFRRMKDDPNVFVRRYAREGGKVIDGEFRRETNDDQLPRQ